MNKQFFLQRGNQYLRFYVRVAACIALLCFSTGAAADQEKIDIPRFGVNNPNPFFGEAAMAGARVSKLLPLEWSSIEPFPPAKYSNPATLRSIVDFEVKGLPESLRRQLQMRLDTLHEKLPQLLKADFIQKIQDTRGRWHFFNWKSVDEFVRGSQEAGMESMFVLHLNTLWASDPGCLKVRRNTPRGMNCPLRNESLASAASFFVRSLVERYDGDGVQDMPGLKIPIRFWSDGNEYNVPAFFGGTNEQYLLMWKAFTRGVRQADAERAVILANGIANVNEIRKEVTNGRFSPCKALKVWLREHQQNGYPESDLLEQLLSWDCEADDTSTILKTLATSLPSKIVRAARNRLAWRKRSVEFFFQQLDHPELYDVFVPHVYTYFRFDPYRVSEEMNFVFKEMETRGYRKQVLVEEMGGAYLRDRELGNAFKEGEAVLKAVLSGEPVATRSYYRELAVEMVQLHATMFGNGIDGLVRYPFRDVSPENAWGASGYAVQGMVQIDWTDGSIAIRKPSYYTYNIMSNKLEGFTSARELAPGCVEFNFGDSKRPNVYVVWSNEDSFQLDLSPLISTDFVRVSHIVTKLKDQQPVLLEDEYYPTNNIPVGDVPIFVEAF